MQVFTKLFWGFDPELWPVVTFSKRGSLTSLLERSKPGDLMAFAATAARFSRPLSFWNASFQPRSFRFDSSLSRRALAPSYCLTM